METESSQPGRSDSHGPSNASMEVNEIVIPNFVATDTKNKFKFRYMIQFLVFYGMFLVYSMRTNLSITILSMVNDSKTESTLSTLTGLPESDDDANVIESKAKKFPWSATQKGWVLNAFFCGYITTQIAGGYLAENFSVKWVFGYGIFLTSVLTILSQVAVEWHYLAFIFLRILEGVCEGVTYPSLYALCARWSPASERTWMAGIANLGTIIGTVVTVPVSAFLCTTDWGWPSVFYVFGSLGLMWGGVWYLLATSTPEKCRWMSEEERTYIVSTRGVLSFEDRKAQRVPWKRLLTSRAVWIISICKFTNSFIFYIFLTEIPNYLHTILKFEMQNNSYVNAAAYMSNAVVALIASWSADVFIARNPAKITRVRKWYECSAQFLGALTMASIPLFGRDQSAVVVVLILNSAVNGLTAGGDVAIPIDIGPSQAGAIQGFANTISNIAGILCPLLVAHLTNHNETFGAWNTVFFITAAISFTGGLLFLFWGSADVEEWAKDEEQEGLVETN